MPLPGVYLVKPSFKAPQAASTATAGEGKSGSPAPKSTIDTPRALSSEAMRDTRSVADSPIEEARRERFTAADGITGPSPLTGRGGEGANKIDPPPVSRAGDDSAMKTTRLFVPLLCLLALP